MRVIIIGAGEVGSELAAKLSREDLDVTVIDRNKQTLERLAALDVMTIAGNGASLDLLEAASVKNTELVIAVTEVDEINIMACLLAKSNGAKKTIARVRQSEFGSEYRNVAHANLGIDVVINPELVTATEIMKVIKSTYASEIEFFARGKVQMLGFRLTEESPLINKPLRELTMQQDTLVVGINRDNEFIIPSGSNVLRPLDHIFLLTKPGQHLSYEWLTGKPTSPFKRIMIIGAGKVGRHLARMLGKYRRLGVEVKLIDSNLTRCQEIAEQLPDTLVLHGNGTDLEFLKQEDIMSTDVFIAVSGSDETNILSSLLAKKMGVKKAVVEINRPDYAMLVDTLDIDTAVRPRLLTAARILRLVRKGSIISVTILGEDQAEIIELDVKPRAKVLNTQLAKLNLPKGMLVGAIVREDKVKIPRGNDWIESGDRVVLFALSDLSQQAVNLFSE